MVSIALVAAVFMTGMAAHMAETCKQGHGNVVGITGDINMDGEVNQLDLSLLGQAWNSRFGDSYYNACADLNMDRVIDLKDLSILGRHWGRKGFCTYAIPNPLHDELCATVSFEGTWVIEGSRTVILDCQKVGAMTTNPLNLCAINIRILSSGDSIQDTYCYRDVWKQHTIEHRGSKHVDWTIVTYGESYESWNVAIRDNGDHYIKLELSSLVQCYGSQRYSIAKQTIEIKW